MQHEISIGHALAYLADDIAKGGIQKRSELSEPAEIYLRTLRSRWQTIQTDLGIEAVLAAIPRTSCQSGKSYLEHNVDFFLARLLICGQVTKSENGDSCNRMFIHLNDCYRCFEEFCHVLRDFEQKRQEFPAN